MNVNRASFRSRDSNNLLKDETGIGNVLPFQHEVKNKTLLVNLRLNLEIL